MFLRRQLYKSLPITHTHKALKAKKQSRRTRNYHALKLDAATALSSTDHTVQQCMHFGAADLKKKITATMRARETVLLFTITQESSLISSDAASHGISAVSSRRVVLIIPKENMWLCPLLLRAVHLRLQAANRPTTQSLVISKFCEHIVTRLETWNTQYAVCTTQGNSSGNRNRHGGSPRRLKPATERCKGTHRSQPRSVMKQ